MLLNKESPGSVLEWKKKKTGINISSELESYKYLDLTTQLTPTMMTDTFHSIEEEYPQNEPLSNPWKYPADEIHLLDEENP
ncbi:7081_t:CDS:2 [Paraglomus occultum]|uniref:7081_t:CDS:1 n=1 Tax=Paraglomus occultum TaxID=144539 RepID=A0A9N9GWD5_9GLOM|nr:7081_t:CDS:2 [Paraglomus occultum]